MIITSNPVWFCIIFMELISVKPIQVKCSSLLSWEACNLVWWAGTLLIFSCRIENDIVFFLFIYYFFFNSLESWSSKLDHVLPTVLRLCILTHGGLSYSEIGLNTNDQRLILQQKNPTFYNVSKRACFRRIEIKSKPFPRYFLYFSVCAL